MMLPSDYRCAMQQLLGDQWDNYVKCLADSPAIGLRINKKRMSKEAFFDRTPFDISENPLCGDGAIVKTENVKCGAHPYHEAGVYYVQEPSAMSAAQHLNVQNGEKVLDLCAAPGGKSSQLCLSAGMDGFFICNEIHPGRANILNENMERMGMGHALILNETPAHLSAKFPQYFNKILVDAPCSGEGMFRKDPATVSQWSLDNVRLCHERQVDILDHAARMLCAGGRMLYSTCTFNTLENEGTLEVFLQSHPDFSLIETHRLYPFETCGEGHFIALLEKEGENRISPAPFLGSKRHESMDSWVKKEIGFSRIETFGKYLCAVSPELPDLKGLKVVRPGLQLFENAKPPHKPAHALAMWLDEKQAQSAVSLPYDQAMRYLRGEAIEIDLPSGWTLVCYDGCPLGWGKAVPGRLQNHRPKGLRRG